ncbi:MAG: hypothetical protein FJ134_00530 [Deltaproteobacteria bacterium]|nr:hypothetical protein [Deltaproteobacteria bacterium]
MIHVHPPRRSSRASGSGWCYLLWLALLTFWFSSLPAWAIPEGGGRVGGSFYSLQFRTLGQQFSLSEAYGFLDLFQNIPNYGLVEGRVAFSKLQEPAGSNDPTGWRQAYGRLSLKNYRWGRGVLALAAGDDAFNLTEFPVKFTSFFYPLVYYRGLGIQYAHPWFQVYLLGGEVTRSRGLAGETFLGLGESLYGVMARFQPYERLLLETNFYLTRNEKDFTGNLVTKDNQVYRLAGQWRVWSQLYSTGEFMQSFSAGPQSQKERDLAYRAGGMWKGDRLRLETNYRYFGPRFHLINEIFQPDQAVKGYYVAGEAKPWPFLSAFGSLDTARNFAVDPGQSITQTETRSLGLGFYRAPWPSSYVRYNESNLITRSDFPVAVRGRTRSLYSETMKKFGFIDAYARYERFQFSDQINPGRSYRKEAPVLGVRAFHKKFLWYVEGEYDRFSPPSAGQGFDGLYLKVGGNYFASPDWSVYGEVSYRPSSRRYGGQLGVYWNLPYGFRIRAFGRIEKGTTGTGDFINNFYTNQITLEIIKVLSWGKKVEVAGLKPGQEWLGSGSIEGWVFNDVNANQSLDSGEQGVENVRIKLEDGSTTVTDRKGYYQFPAVAAGKHVVTLDSRKIPAAFTFEGAETLAVEVKRRATARADFPFVRGASIRGRVVEDVKGAGKPPPDAKGVPDVLLVLKPGDLNTYTDSEGDFAFEGVVPKEYELSILAETLPEDTQVTTLPAIKVTLTPGGQAHGLIFGIHRRERPIIFK